MTISFQELNTITAAINTVENYSLISRFSAEFESGQHQLVMHVSGDDLNVGRQVVVLEGGSYEEVAAQVNEMLNLETEYEVETVRVNTDSSYWSGVVSDLADEVIDGEDSHEVIDSYLNGETKEALLGILSQEHTVNRPYVNFNVEGTPDSSDDVILQMAFECLSSMVMAEVSDRQQ